MKKKIAALVLVIALAATAVIGGTLAYFTDTDEAENVFTVGNVDIALTETEWVEPTDPVYPGQTLPKNPTVVNNGSNPCYVRIKVEGLDALGAGNDITLNDLSVNWTKNGDYYYYNTVLDVDTSTDALFASITIPTTVTNDQATAAGAEAYSVDITAYAIQAQGIAAADPDNPTIEEIAAWFDTCMPATEPAA